MHSGASGVACLELVSFSVHRSAFGLSPLTDSADPDDRGRAAPDAPYVISSLAS